MAVYTSDGTGDTQVGSVAPMYPSKTELSVALTLKITGTSASRRVATWWGNGANEQGWLIGMDAGGDEIAFLLTDGASGFNGQQTTAANLTTDVIYRMMFTFLGSGSGGMELNIWINGTQMATSNIVGSASFASFGGATLNVTQIGREQDENVNGVVGEYSEWAMWSTKVPDWVAVAYGKGMSPRFWRKDGMLYAPCKTITLQDDEFHGQAVTSASMTSVAHPSVLMPRPAALRGAAASSASAFRRTLHRLGTRIGSRQVQGGW